MMSYLLVLAGQIRLGVLVRHADPVHLADPVILVDLVDLLVLALPFRLVGLAVLEFLVYRVHHAIQIHRVIPAGHSGRLDPLVQVDPALHVFQVYLVDQVRLLVPGLHAVQVGHLNLIRHVVLVVLPVRSALVCLVHLLDPEFPVSQILHVVLVHPSDLVHLVNLKVLSDQLVLVVLCHRVGLDYQVCQVIQFHHVLLVHHCFLVDLQVLAHL